MSKSLTICYITMREHPRFSWFMDSLHRQQHDDLKIKLVVVTRKIISAMGLDWSSNPWLCKPIFVHPKPSVWQGENRLTKEDWFAASNARNTGLCFADTDWIAYVDDLSVMMPGWLQSVREAMEQNYLVCGAYQKVKNLVVEHGEVKSFDINPGGIDSRWSQARQDVYPCSGDWLYGCSCAMPVEALLKIGGWLEICDGLGFEDVCTGIALNNAGYGFRYDRRMLTYESEEAHFEEPPMKKTDKGKSPLDKSHAVLRIVRTGQKFFDNYYEGGIASERERVLRGESFTVRKIPERDWFDGQLISEM